MTMGKTMPTAEWRRRVLATLFVSVAAVALSAFVLESDAGPAEAAYAESWASPSEVRTSEAQTSEARTSEAQTVLSFEFYRENVEPIFMRGHGEGGLVPGACVMCHSWQVGTPFKLQ